MSADGGDTVHPLARLLLAAAEGRFPPADGAWRRVPPWRPGLEAVVAFTGHAVLALDPATPDAVVQELGADGFGGAHDPRLVSSLAGPHGWIDSLDLVMGRPGAGSASLEPRLVHRPDLADHPRARFAARIRDDVVVLGHPQRDRSAVAILGRGLAGLLELSIELEPGRRGAGAGAELVADALTTAPADQLVVAAVAPGNAASLRALLSAGFVPLGSLQLFRRG